MMRDVGGAVKNSPHRIKGSMVNWGGRPLWSLFRRAYCRMPHPDLESYQACLIGTRGIVRGWLLGAGGKVGLAVRMIVADGYL